MQILAILIISLVVSYCFAEEDSEDQCCFPDTEEIVLKIFSYLPPEDLYNCSLVRKSWCNVSLDNSLDYYWVGKEKEMVLYFSYSRLMRTYATASDFNPQIDLSKLTNLTEYPSGQSRWPNLHPTKFLNLQKSNLMNLWLIR